MKKVIFYLCIVCMLFVSACASQRSGCNMTKGMSGVH